MEDWTWKLLPVVALVAQGLLAWIFWSLSRKYMTCDACQELRSDYDKRLDGVQAEGQALRSCLTNLPTTGDVGKLAREIEAVRGGQEALRESVKSLGISIDRQDKPINLILEHLLNGERK